MSGSVARKAGSLYLKAAAMARGEGGWGNEDSRDIRGFQICCKGTYHAGLYRDDFGMIVRNSNMLLGTYAAVFAMCSLKHATSP